MMQTITTAEQLDALPVGTIVRDRERWLWQKFSATEWQCGGPYNRPFPSSYLVEYGIPEYNFGPFEVVFEPDRLVSRALRDVATERESHTERGFNVAHDDMHNVHDLTQLALRYVNLSGSGRYSDAEPGYISRTALVKAGSLLVAAIDRLDRSEADRG